MDNQALIDILKMVWPIILIQLVLQVYAIVDIIQKKKTRNLSVPIWVVVIILGEIIGSVLYLMFGRSEE